MPLALALFVTSSGCFSALIFVLYLQRFCQGFQLGLLVPALPQLECQRHRQTPTGTCNYSTAYGYRSIISSRASDRSIEEVDEIRDPFLTPAVILTLSPLLQVIWIALIEVHNPLYTGLFHFFICWACPFVILGVQVIWIALIELHNPLYTGLFHFFYILGLSICHFRGVGSILSLLSYFWWKFLLANSVNPNQKPQWRLI